MAISMLEYVEDDKICRSRQLLAYFGQKQEDSCNICDVCLVNKKRALSAEDFEATLQIVKAQLTKGPITFKELINLTHIPEEKATTIVRFLIDKKMVTIDSRQQLIYNQKPSDNTK